MYECGGTSCDSNPSILLLRTTSDRKVQLQVRDSDAAGNPQILASLTSLTENGLHHIVAERDLSRHALLVYVDGRRDAAVDVNGDGDGPLTATGEDDPLTI